MEDLGQINISYSRVICESLQVQVVRSGSVNIQEILDNVVHGDAKPREHAGSMLNLITKNCDLTVSYGSATRSVQ